MRRPIVSKRDLSQVKESSVAARCMPVCSAGAPALPDFPAEESASIPTYALARSFNQVILNNLEAIKALIHSKQQVLHQSDLQALLSLETRSLVDRAHRRSPYLPKNTPPKPPNPTEEMAMALGNRVRMNAPAANGRRASAQRLHASVAARPVLLVAARPVGGGARGRAARGSQTGNSLTACMHACMDDETALIDTI